MSYDIIGPGGAHHGAHAPLADSWRLERRAKALHLRPRAGIIIITN